MAGKGGAQAPDYKPRPPAGPGAAANRQDMTRGDAAQPGTSPLTGAPTTPAATGIDGPYGMRSELQGLMGSAPTAPSSPPGGGGRRGSSAPPGFADQFEESPEEPLPLEPPIPPEAMAAYSPSDIRDLEQAMPLLHKLAVQPDASPAVQMLFHLAGEVVLHAQTADRSPLPTIGPSWMDGAPAEIAPPGTPAGPDPFGSGPLPPMPGGPLG